MPGSIPLVEYGILLEAKRVGQRKLQLIFRRMRNDPNMVDNKASD